jgi:hypothetical protein
MKSDVELIEKAKREKLDFAEYVTDLSTFKSLQVGQTVEIELKYKEQLDVGIPIRFASKITVKQ